MRKIQKHSAGKNKLEKSVSLKGTQAFVVHLWGSSPYQTDLGDQSTGNQKSGDVQVWKKKM